MPNSPHSTPQSRLVTMNGHDYAWDPTGGLDPAVVVEVEGYIRRKAWGYKGWAESVALDVEDLIQEGFTGALKAAGKYSPDRGANFLTYASWWIDAAMREAMGRRMIRTPEGRPHVWVGSLEAPLGPEGEDEGLSLLAVTYDEAPDPLELSLAAEQRERLLAALPSLEPRVRDVLLRHTGLDGRTPEPLQKIALEMGVSRQRVSQILERATSALTLELAG